MKTFEKWWNTLCCIGDAEALEKSKSRYQTGFCNGHRIALEKVLKQIDEAVEDREEGIFIENMIVDWIKEELNRGVV